MRDTNKDRQVAEGCYLVTGILLEAGMRQSLRVLVMVGDTHAVARIAEDSPDLFKPAVNNDVKFLELPVRHNRLKMVRLLLDLGAGPNSPDDEPWATPLAWAERRGPTDIVKLLKAYGPTFLKNHLPST